jgi:hypothetical protein
MFGMRSFVTQNGTSLKDNNALLRVAPDENLRWNEIPARYWSTRYMVMPLNSLG